MKMVLLAILASALQPTPAASPDDDRIFAASSYVAQSGAEDGGWFQLGGGRQHFLLAPDDAEAAMRLVSAVQDRGLAIRVRYDAGAGHLEPGGTYVVYPVCSLSVANGAILGDERRNCPPPALARSETTEDALVLGIAMVPARPAEARRLLTRAFETPALRLLAIEGRGRASLQIATSLPSGSEASDAAFADALADFRTWVSLAPDSVDARYAVGQALENLGGYEEALAIYRGIGGQWPDQDFDVMRATATLLRRQGRYAEALRVLDDYAILEGPQAGMAFHYHRAWTLNLLNRPREVLEEMNLGLADQPDYAYGIIVRACANARLGRIDAALTDERRAAELLERLAADDMTDFGENLATVRRAVSALELLAASHSRSANDIPCREIWDRDSARRSRSPLLGAAPH